jgi:outer membrane protein OmpA-like peptidoglycan-associated protein
VEAESAERLEKLKVEAEAAGRAAKVEREAEAKQEVATAKKEAAAAKKMAKATPPAPGKTSKESVLCEKRLSEAASAGVILFDRASADIDPSSSKTIARLAEIAKNCPGTRVQVNGYTDSEGEADRNQNLSERRARAVVKSLVKAGVDPSRLTAVGFGADDFAAPNDTPENMARNRRIEFKVFSN